MQGLLGHSLQNALWLSHSASQNFRENTPTVSADPSHQQGARQRNRKHQGPWRLALAAFGACFLRLQKGTLGSTSGRCKDALQDHSIWLWRSLTFRSLAATYEGKGKCAVPFSCRTPGPPAARGGSHEQAAMYLMKMIMIHNIPLSQTFAKKNLFRELEKNFREGFQHNMHGFRN